MGMIENVHSLVAYLGQIHERIVAMRDLVDKEDD